MPHTGIRSRGVNLLYAWRPACAEPTSPPVRNVQSWRPPYVRNFWACLVIREYHNSTLPHIILSARNVKNCTVSRKDLSINLDLRVLSRLQTIRATVNEVHINSPVLCTENADHVWVLSAVAAGYCSSTCTSQVVQRTPANTYQTGFCNGCEHATKSR